LDLFVQQFEDVQGRHRKHDESTAVCEFALLSVCVEQGRDGGEFSVLRVYSDIL